MSHYYSIGYKYLISDGDSKSYRPVRTIIEHVTLGRRQKITQIDRCPKYLWHGRKMIELAKDQLLYTLVRGQLQSTKTWPLNTAPERESNFFLSNQNRS